jgi:hypothetical protein
MPKKKNKNQTEAYADIIWVREPNKPVKIATDQNRVKLKSPI